ncbi:MAG TPA: hypothetical protein VGG74_31775 [Kofleriaceae bacterium]|jgi:hypothetical protein
MAGSRKEKLELHTDGEEASDEREVYLPGGRTLTVAGEVVEIKSGSGMLELRIRLTDQGPVLQMESVRLELKATESVAIESKRVEIKATEELALSGKQVEVDAEEDVHVEGKGDVRVIGKMIHLN